MSWGNLPSRRPDQVFRPAIPGIGAGGAAGTVRATKVIIIGSGGELLVYSPTAAAGNLIASIAGANGTDTYGNAFVQGVTSYQAPGVGVASGLQGGQIQLYTGPVSGAGPWTSQFSLTTNGAQVQLNVVGSDSLSMLSSTGTLSTSAGTTIDGLMAGGAEAFKSATTSLTSQTTLQVDPDLQLQGLIGGATYHIEFGLVGLAGGDTPGIKWQLAGSGLNSAFNMWVTQIASGAANPQILGRAFNNLFTAVGAAQAIFGAGVMTCAGSGLVAVTMTWAQNSSSGTATSVGPGSYLRAARVA
jgi:hypothetical protein